MRAGSRREELYDESMSIFVGGAEARGGGSCRRRGGGFDGRPVDRDQPELAVRVVFEDVTEDDWFVGAERVGEIKKRAAT